MVIPPLFECVGRARKRQHKPAAAERSLLPKMLGPDVKATILIRAKMLGSDVVAASGIEKAPIVVSHIA